ncbi:E3 ubiquitin-protein ligase UBR5 isoform X1 [Hydra vulgaris]|uniref:E3 ubiquitin-protein ligase UBR5 isoform X1 n=2 Tax=Hydra vulgaris TaxID=6087 RepID=UPI001F5EE5F3|nr:E3 ubiquitin-protein ligase UBR5-like [Hydra vulgaris]
MASVVIVSHHLKSSPEKFFDGLKELVKSKTNVSNWGTNLPELDASMIVQCVVGPNHLAFLMSDGRVCRVAFHIVSESAKFYKQKEPSSDEEMPVPVSINKTPVSSSTSNAEEALNSRTDISFSLSGETLSSLSNQLSRWTSQRISTASTSSTGTITSLASRVASVRGRGRIIRATRGRIGTGWLGSTSRALLPASAVPEDLIAQAQVVLQGKSRQVIIRELQKTSLDVNLAVNNLLSRDDDDPDDDNEDSYIQEAYLPNDDLISIFEAGIPSEEPFVVQRDPLFPEDILLNPLYTRGEAYHTTNRTQSSENNATNNREGRDMASSRLRDRWWGMIMKDDTKQRSSSKPTTQQKSRKATSNVETSQRFGEIQWWRFKDESDDSIKFSQIASLHSELLAVTENGFLHRWRWADPESPVTEITGHVHPRAADMNLTDNEKIVKISSCNVRISILTESGKIAAWFDDTLSAVGHKLEQPLQTFSEFKGNSISKLHVCDLYSCVQLSNGALYWWGVFPFEQRKKVLDKVKAKAKKSAISGSNLIKSGTQVCIRSCPLYYPGAIGFTTVNGEPKVGELMEQAWTIVEKCRFKIVNAIPKIVDTSKHIENQPDDQINENEDPGPSQHKRRRLDENSEDSSAQLPVIVKEEQWCLKDVIFVEEVRNVPVGTVLKVDGAYALVDFSTKKVETGKCDIGSILDECRLVRKDELQIVKWTTPPKMPECFQRTPKQLILPPNSKALSIALDTKGVRVLLKTQTGLRYVTFSLATGRAESGGDIQQAPSLFLSKTQPHCSVLNSSGIDSLTLLQDPNQCLYPLIKDNSNGIRTPDLLNMPPVTCLAMGRRRVNDTNKGHLIVAVMIVKDSDLVQSVLQSDAEAIHQFFSNCQIEKHINERVDGNRNIFHLCVSTCKPLSPKPNKKNEEYYVSSPYSPSSPKSNKRNEDNSKTDIFDSSMWVPLFDGDSCLDILLSHSFLSQHLFQLLSERDAFGCTPFMYAVKIRAYTAALKLYNAAVDISRENGPKNKDKFMAMICPPGTDPDISPLLVLCCNDTCSFTWTGTKHINQDIFECKTCGLVGPLCCCTECAQVCHVGHECKLKRTSPTAYCDCWEKCPCKSLISGDQSARNQLLHKLVDETDLCTLPNNRGQHILLFLVHTVARQNTEQTQYVQKRNSSSDTSKSSGVRKVHSQKPLPYHDLEPPKFAKTTLLYILKNWLAVKSMILFGCNSTGIKRTQSLDDNIVMSSMLQADEISKYLDGQNGTTLLDNFVHKLLVKCYGESLEALLQLFQQRLANIKKNQSDDENVETLNVINRFIRSVVRVYVLYTAPTETNQIKRKGISAVIMKCKRVFASLNVFAAKQIADIAASLFAPVRMGVVYPSAPFTLGTGLESAAACDDLFTVLPLPGRKDSVNPLRVRFADNDQADDTEEMESEESHGVASTTTEYHQYMDMGETDSDSDDSQNGDGAETQSIEVSSETTLTSTQQTRSDTDGYFSTTEVSETEGEEDDEDPEDEDEDEEEEEDDNTTQLDLERAPPATSIADNSNTTPRVLQWAVRDTSSTTPSTSGSTRATSSGVYYIDTSRRSGASATSDGASTSLFSTPSALARTFAILVREVSDLLGQTSEDNSLAGPCYPIEDNILKETRDTTDKILFKTWQWLWRVMELTESQLRFGASLTAVSDPMHPQHPLHDVQNKPSRGSSSTSILNVWSEYSKKKKSSTNPLTDTSSSTRQDFLSYLLSLMRSHHNEHGDSLPKVEITALQHLAYVLDAFIYYLRSNTVSSSEVILPAEFSLTESKSTNESKTTKTSGEDDESDETDTDDFGNEIDTKASNHRFFKRSDSTLVLGYEPADSFAPLKEALPLADRPHLLTPSGRRDQFFGVKKSTDSSFKLDSTFSLGLNDSTSCVLLMSPNVYLSRWHMCLELFGRVFLDDVGSEPHSILNELGRFDVKEAKFKREMEKLKNGHQKDLYLEGLDRSRPLLLQQTLRQLNSQFGRRLPGAGPLNIHRLKVSFKDEPGEGSGVVRSFYTAISNAFLTNERLPNLDNIFSGSRGLTHQLRARAREREKDIRRGLEVTDMVPRNVRRHNDRSNADSASTLSIDALPYNPESESSLQEDLTDIPVHKKELGKRLYSRIQAISPANANKITGMILELPPTQIIHILTSSESILIAKVNEATELLNGKMSSSKSDPDALVDDYDSSYVFDNSPLFFQPGKPGYYSPRPGKNVIERINCFRNVGRIIGLCLLQNELCPLVFNRHVIKYLLGRKISWHDLAFFDPILYESLRQLIEDSKREDSSKFFSDLDLTYCIQLRPEEGGGTVELVKGGSHVEVAPDNVHDYVKRYAEYRMVVNSRRALQAMRRGLLDVIPANHLESLTAEDFRLLLNGIGNICIQQLMSYTFFSDETAGEGQEKLTKFKKWFWSIVENMTPKQKQDLLYFWTSSPAMPASAEGFQPLPSVTVKPANDHQLPTANTCISRLYVPLYSSKAILRNKFLLAIKTKVFGFV